MAVARHSTPRQLALALPTEAAPPVAARRPLSGRVLVIDSQPVARELLAHMLTQGVDSQPITAGLSSLNGQWIAQWHLVSAGSILAALPPVAMFFLMQKHFIAGLTLGAVK